MEQPECVRHDEQPVGRNANFRISFFSARSATNVNRIKKFCDKPPTFAAIFPGPRMARTSSVNPNLMVALCKRTAAIEPIANHLWYL